MINILFLIAVLFSEQEPYVPDIVVIPHGRPAQELVERLTGRCGDREIWVEYSLGGSSNISVGIGTELYGLEDFDIFENNRMPAKLQLFCRPNDSGVDLNFLFMQKDRDDRPVWTDQRVSMDWEGRVIRVSVAGPVEVDRELVNWFW